VSEANSILWNSGRDEDKATVRERKRRLHYVSNIMIVEDPANPSNNGKVFLFKFGKKIFDKIMDVMQPQFQDEDPVNPYDFWEGANFKLKIRNVEGYRNYDKSEFASPKAISDDDTKLESLYNGMYNLGEFEDPANYKTYSELQAKLQRVLGESVDAGAQSIAQAAQMNEPAPDPMANQPMTAESVGELSSDDDTMSYFAKLAQDD
jgi:hypothetical protein